MSLYTLSGNQLWEQPPIDPTQPGEVVGYSSCNQYGIPRSEDDSKEQEDLVARFARQMNMTNPTPSGASSQAPASISYSITQHYHHSSHVARQEPPDGSSKEHFSTPTETTSLDGILMSNNVNPTSLTPMQRRLFEYAMPDQRSRLLQMWQICLADSPLGIAEAMEGGYAQSLAAEFTPTTSNETAHPSSMHDIEMSDQSRGEIDDDVQNYAEPYMVSGYEDIAQKDSELSAHAIMSLAVEPTTGVPYKIANDPVYGIRGSTLV